MLFKRFVTRMEGQWFGRWRGLLSGRRIHELDRTRLQSYVNKIQEMAVEIVGKRIQNRQLLEVLQQRTSKYFGVIVTNVFIRNIFSNIVCTTYYQNRFAVAINSINAFVHEPYKKNILTHIFPS